MDQSVVDAAGDFNYETVAARIGDVMEVVGASPVMHLKLTEIVRSPLDGAEWEAFALYLDGDPKRPLPQGVYRLVHPYFGAMDAFLSPKSAVQYELVFSHRKGG